jgi:hypothetical protein
MTLLGRKIILSQYKTYIIQEIRLTNYQPITAATDDLKRPPLAEKRLPSAHSR